MSQQNIELHRRSVSAVNARDADGYIELTDPKIELHSVFAAVGGASYHGHGGVRKWFQDLTEAWGHGVRFEVEAYFDLGDCTVAVGALHGRGQQSGAEVSLTGFQAITWSNGLAVHYKAYTEKSSCLEDLGVSENTLDPIAP